jgi:hypothetical protein
MHRQAVHGIGGQQNDTAVQQARGGTNHVVTNLVIHSLTSAMSQLRSMCSGGKRRLPI